MTKRTLLGWLTPGIIAALVILALFLVPWAQVDLLLSPQTATAAEGDTNLTNLVLSGDLTVTDDVTITDDLTVSDALTVAGATALNGGLAMDTNKFTVANTSGNTAIAGTLTQTGAASFAAAITAGSDIENMLLPTIDSAAIITSTNGAVWTAGASEIWFVHALYCNITTNFDCTGDDCIIHIGDGTDEDGFLDLDDGELQTTDTEITGAKAGWQGMYTDTAGAYLAGNTMNGFVYGNDTVDIKIEDSSAHTNPTAGAATCYLIYTRLQ